MPNFTPSILQLFCLLVVLSPGAGGNSAAAGVAIVPEPSVIEPHGGLFTLSPQTLIISATAAPEATLLSQSLRTATGLPLKVTEQGDAKGSIQLLLQPGSNDPEGAYTLDVRPDGVIVASESNAGLFYGTQTLRQLLPSSVFGSTLVDGTIWSIPCAHIQDRPQFQWRGMMLDCSRHFFPVSFVKRFIDLLAIHKMNCFHWHLTDDQGWRIEIKKYPKLTGVGSHRAGTFVFDPANPKVLRFDGVPYEGYYTQDDVRSVVAYAAIRHVTVVPEIEMPGHSAAAIAAYPELGVTGQLIQVRTAWGVEKHILNPNAHTIAFYKDVLTEVMDLFPSPYIHIGGDEAPKDEWNASPEIQAQIKSLGLANSDALQAWFTGQMDQFLAAHGRRLIGWDEILQGGLTRGATVMSWHGSKPAVQAANQGNSAVNSSKDFAYLDYYQSRDHAREPYSIGGFVPLEKVYAFNPMPQGLSAKQQRFIVGGQAQLWTEYIATVQHVEYMAYPRGCAIAEDDWSDPAKKNYADFLNRLKIHLERLKAMNVSFRPLDTTASSSTSEKVP